MFELDADTFTSIAFCNAFHTLALILEKDLLNWLVEPLLVCKRCFASCYVHEYHY